jgi:hypothetical protein
VEYVDARPALNFGEVGVNEVTLKIFSAANDAHEVIEEGEEEDGDEESEDDSESIDGPVEGELLLIERIGDVDDHEDDKQDQHYKDVEDDDVSIPCGLFEEDTQLNKVESIVEYSRDAWSIPDGSDGGVEGEDHDLEELYDTYDEGDNDGRVLFLQ